MEKYDLKSHLRSCGSRLCPRCDEYWMRLGACRNHVEGIIGACAPARHSDGRWCAGASDLMSLPNIAIKVLLQPSRAR